MGGFLHGFIQTLFIIRLPFCSPNIIGHFMCDLNPLLNLVCTDTHTTGLFVALSNGFIHILNFLLLTGFCVVILHALKTKTLEVRQKVISTCVSHVMVVVLFLCPAYLFVYLRPVATLPNDKAVAMLYTLITSMYIPFNIYFEKCSNEKFY